MQTKGAVLTLLCLVMLNLLTRPPVRPAAATQLPQLLRRGGRVEGRGADTQPLSPCKALAGASSGRT